MVSCLLLAGAYLAAARLGLALDAVSGFAAPVWPPTGLALAALLLGGSALWPGVLLGAVAANLWVGAPPLAALAVGLGNTLEAAIAVRLLRRFGFEASLGRVRDVALLGAAALATPLLSAGIGVASLRLASVVAADQMWPALRAWWIGDTLGALVVAPLLITFPVRDRRLPGRPRAERLLLVAFTALSIGLVFGGRQADGLSFQLPFLIFPAVVWTTFRLGQRAGVRATFVVSVAAIAATAVGWGPFARPQLHEGLLMLQVFMGIASGGALLLGAVEAERTRVQGALGEAVAIRDEFLSIAGHELRTPLAALALELGTLQRRLLQTAAAPPAPGAVEALAQRASRATRQVERLTQLVNRLLEVSQLRSGRPRPERQRLDLRALVNEVVDRFTEQAQQAGCALTVEAGPAVNGAWDPLAIEQVTGNLLANAIKYGAGKPIRVSLHTEQDRALLAVRDEGIGVPREEVDRIFDRFARAVPARHFGGLGLGLYIARQLVEAHGGTIAVTSQPGAGSTFVVNLPTQLHTDDVT